MISQAQYIKQQWFWLFALSIFFFNSFLLPEGFTLTLLLTPVWVYVLYRDKAIQNTLVLLSPLVLYAALHAYKGIDLSHYTASTIVIISLIFFLAVFKNMVADKATDLDKIFRQIVIFNFLLTLFSIVLFFVPFLRPAVWYSIPVSYNIIIPRLKLFTSEASHYSLLLAPIAIYFYTCALFLKTRNKWLTIFMISLPLLLSFSMGVLGALFISFLLLIPFYYTELFYSTRRKRAFLLSTFVVLSLGAIIYYLYPNNPLSLRLHYVFKGQDTSARGRTYEAFILANKIIGYKSYLWGIGPGQLNILGRNTILQYYKYSSSPSSVRIPNACAETILFFGYVGFAIRIAIQIILFVKTKVASNPFRFWLFTFVFIYQFTGSYITNVTEYMIWILAFSNIFPQFVKNKQAKPAA